MQPTENEANSSLYWTLAVMYTLRDQFLIPYGSFFLGNLVTMIAILSPNLVQSCQNVAKYSATRNKRGKQSFRFEFNDLLFQSTIIYS